MGAGITLQPTGLHVLRRLGLNAEVVARGARIDRLTCTTPSGRLLIDLRYESEADLLHNVYRQQEGRPFGLGLHRGVLFESLHGALAGQNVPIVTGVDIVGMRRVSAARAALHRVALVDAVGASHGAHELVVVADGARSRFGSEVGAAKRLTPYPWGAPWFVGREHRPAHHPMTGTIDQIADGNRRLLGILPTGLGPRRSAEEHRLVSLFWSLRRDTLEEWRARGLDAWKNEVRALSPDVVGLLDQITDIDQLLFAVYHDASMPRWHASRIVVLGDAAHATSPQLGQGCNLALWDAMVLADTIAEEQDRATPSLERALRRYSANRHDHLAYYQWATRFLTPFFQSDAWALGILRDLMMPLFGKVPFTQRLMTRSMLGLMDGFAGRVLDFPG